jgi:hypothetical protein
MVEQEISQEWNEVAPGVYQRGLGAYDRFFDLYVSDPRGYIGRLLNVCVKLQSVSKSKERAFIESARMAWKTARYNHPNLACVTDGNVMQYETLKTEADVDEWIDQTFRVVEDYTVSELWEKGYMNTEKLSTFLVFPNEGALVVRVVHTLIDGIGMIYLINNILRYMAYPIAIKFGDEGKNLAPAFSVALNLPPPSSKILATARHIIDESMTRFSAISLKPDRDPKKTKLVPRMLKYILNKQSSSKLFAVCKQQGITVSEALSAAIILAAKRQSATEGLYTNATAVDYRALNVAPYNNSADYPAGVYIGLGMLIVQPQTFLETVHSLQKCFQQIKSSRIQTAQFTEPIMDIIRQRLEAAGLRRYYGTAPMLSHLGKIDHILSKNYGRFQVEDFWLSVDYYTLEMWFATWTWNEQLTFALCFNSGAYSDQTANELWGMVENELNSFMNAENT